MRRIGDILNSKRLLCGERIYDDHDDGGRFDFLCSLNIIDLKNFKGYYQYYSHNTP